jgi:predicted membrane GTPase involved in stress response
MATYVPTGALRVFPTDEVVEEAQDLLLDLAADLEDPAAQAAAEHALELPVVFASGRAGKASTTQPANGQEPEGENLDELFALLYDVIPAPRGDADVGTLRRRASPAPRMTPRRRLPPLPRRRLPPPPHARP